MYITYKSFWCYDKTSNFANQKINVKDYYYSIYTLDITNQNYVLIINIADVELTEFSRKHVCTRE